MKHTLLCSLIALAGSMVLLGCKSDPEAELPPEDRTYTPSNEAIFSSTGVWSQVIERDGKIVVFDATSSELLGEFEVREGDRFTLNPAERRIQINGVPTQVRRINPNHRHSVFFEQAPG